MVMVMVIVIVIVIGSSSSSSSSCCSRRRTRAPTRTRRQAGLCGAQRQFPFVALGGDALGMMLIWALGFRGLGV